MTPNNLKKINIVFLVVFLAIAVFAVSFGFYKSGSPAYRRQVRTDEDRVTDIKTIVNKINTDFQNFDYKPTDTTGNPSGGFDYYNRYNLSDVQLSQKLHAYKLPEALGKLNFVNADAVLKDPETNSEYHYEPGSDGSYKLCADFHTDSKEVMKANADANTNYDRYSYGVQDFWFHQKGHFCYELSAGRGEYDQKMKALK